MNLHDARTRFLVRRRKLYLAVKSARTQQGGVKNVDTVRCGNHLPTIQSHYCFPDGTNLPTWNWFLAEFGVTMLELKKNQQQTRVYTEMTQLLEQSNHTHLKVTSTNINASGIGQGKRYMDSWSELKDDKSAKMWYRNRHCTNPRRLKKWLLNRWKGHCLMF